MWQKLDKFIQTTFLTYFHLIFVQAGNLNRDVIRISEIKRFIVDCFVASKTPVEHAETMADLLISADHRGHFSHGMNRLEMYLNDLEAGTMDGAANPTVLKVLENNIS